MGVSRHYARALCAVIRPDHFEFASYRPANYNHNFTCFRVTNITFGDWFNKPEKRKGKTKTARAIVRLELYLNKLSLPALCT